MTAKEVLAELEGYGDPQTKKTLAKHGAKEPFFGVKVADLKKILKKTKKNHELSLELYATGNSDAMYLAGLMADETKITEAQLQNWIENAYWHYLSEYAVPWVAAETPYGFELALTWIESDEEGIAAGGWNALASYASLNPDETLDLKKYEELLERAAREVHTAPNRVRYVMNGFIIAIGSYVTPLLDKCLELAGGIGKVDVHMGGTACKVPLAKPYLEKNIEKGRVGKKRKSARC